MKHHQTLPTLKVPPKLSDAAKKAAKTQRLQTSPIIRDAFGTLRHLVVDSGVARGHACAADSKYDFQTYAES